MFSWRILFLRTIVLVTPAICAGCSDPYGGRMEVTGAVKLEGQPLKDGSILFVPLDKQDTPSGAAVINGEYKIPRQNGLKPGQYLVRLTAGDGVTPARLGARGGKDQEEEHPGAPGGSRNIVSMDMIPDEWNVRSKKQVEVKPDAANRFDFDIPNANTPRKRR